MFKFMANLRDISDRTGLSISTVSHILNRNSKRYSEQTRLRVLEAAKDIGYVPNHYAQLTRRGGRSEIIGMIQHAGLFQVSVLKCYAAARAIRDTGYRLLAYDAEWIGHGLDTVCSTMLELRVEGLLLNDPPNVFPTEELQKFRVNNIPVVSLGGMRLPGVPHIRVDARDGMRRLSRHVIGLGYRAVDLVVPDPVGSVRDKSANWGLLERIAGFQDAVAETGLGSARARVRNVGRPNELMSPYANGKATMAAILAEPRRPEAILFSNDDWAIGALAACSEAGVRVPQDIALTGFDNLPIGAFTSSPLTTFSQDYEGMAHAAVDLLIGFVKDKTIPPETAPVVKVPGTLVVRSSCGAPLRNGAAASARRAGQGGPAGTVS